MKVSIITVCKNAEKTIEKTILSVLNQTYKNIEYIIMDGVSTDNTLNVIEKYRENITTIISEPDAGIYNAMNKAIKYATGDIILFLNANDKIYNETVLEKVTNEFKKDNSLSFLFGDVLFVNAKNDIVLEKKYDMFQNIFAFLNNNMCHQCIYYKKEVFERHGNYNEDLPIYADHEFNIRLLVENKLKSMYSPEMFAIFELGSVSTSKSNRKDQLIDHKKAIKYFIKNYPLLSYGHLFELSAKRYFGSIYKPIKNSKLYQRLLNKFCNQKKYELNTLTH